VADLQRFVNAMGGCIEGVGGSQVVVGNCRDYRPVEHTVIGDRIVAATVLSAAAAAGGDVTLTGVDIGMLNVICGAFREAGCSLTVDPHGIHIRVNRRLSAVCPIRTQPYPGFPTDAQAPFMAAAATFEGTTIFIENIFDNRYRHVEGLQCMGADIRIEGRVAIVNGVLKLSGASVKMPDLRAGAALVVAALGAEGETRATGLEHIDRGYQGFAEALRDLGADIERNE
jgi:UDP-N-acetylglucosamine 1-carboxyvinyltransferase